jgi:hypothetical protein
MLPTRPLIPKKYLTKRKVFCRIVFVYKKIERVGMDKKLDLESIFSDREPPRGIHVRVPRSLFEILEGEAKKRNQNLSEVVRDLIALPFVPQVLKDKQILSTEDHDLIKECRGYLSDLSERLNEVSEKGYLIEKVQRKTRELLSKDDVKQKLIEDVSQQVIENLFPRQKSTKGER